MWLVFHVTPLFRYYSLCDWLYLRYYLVNVHYVTGVTLVHYSVTIHYVTGFTLVHYSVTIHYVTGITLDIYSINIHYVAGVTCNYIIPLHCKTYS